MTFDIFFKRCLATILSLAGVLTACAIMLIILLQAFWSIWRKGEADNENFTWKYVTAEFEKLFDI